MIITSIETYPVRVPLKAECRMISALGRHDVSEFLLVRILTDTGLEGAGEASVTARWSGETVWGAEALVQRTLAPQIVGMDPAQLDRIQDRMDQLCSGNWFTKSAIEMACWDILGKGAGKPVFELLGGACRGLTIPSRFSIGAYAPDRAAARASELVAQGFDTIKLKVGGKPEDDQRRVRAVRAAIGQKTLMIDANGGWDADTAIKTVNALRDCDLSLVEQPTPAGDFEALAHVRRETGLPIMADESCFDMVDAKELVRSQCCDLVSVYPGKNGGIRMSKDIAEHCAQNGVSCSIGSNIELDVATAAMAHLIVATENIKVEKYPGDIYGPAYYEFRVVRDPIRIDGPSVTITNQSGLGVQVDWELVKRFRLD